MRKFIAAIFFFLMMFPLFADKPVFYFFHSLTCPHCVQAEPFVDELIKKYSQIEFKKLEVSASQENKIIYIQKIEELKIDRPGVPVFALGKDYIIGFNDSYKKKIEEMIEKNLKKVNTSQ